MAIETNAKRVVKIMKGDTQVWTDTNNWVALKTGPGVTGTVLFRDKGDGTAELVGSVQVQGIVLTLILYPPVGYQFTSVNWNGFLTMAGKTGFARGISQGGAATITDGSLYCSSGLQGGGTNFGTSFGIVFQQGSMMDSANNDLTNSANPALINIKSV